jgi:hypothetical protein
MCIDGIETLICCSRHVQLWAPWCRDSLGVPPCSIAEGDQVAPTPPTPTPTPSAPPLTADPFCTTGVLNGGKDVCCPAACGTCGGYGCKDRGFGYVTRVLITIVDRFNLFISQVHALT